uniref:Uncharacterized protein n=1 Tax=Thermosporothrix sp. COM3 TaxID=2490863 RepID=A0A455SS93_9CHLR|nr:hypothetical protein KTC_46900 [Thermosporothrix sp. COM3]
MPLSGSKWETSTDGAEGHRVLNVKKKEATAVSCDTARGEKEVENVRRKMTTLSNSSSLLFYLRRISAA